MKGHVYKRTVPVNQVADEELLVSKYEKLSATNVNERNACLRHWWYRRVEFLKGPQVPPMMRGNIVEATACAVMRETPALITTEDPPEILASPLDVEGVPDRNSPSWWPAQNITPPHSELWPTDRQGLRDWAFERIDVHLPGQKAAEIEKFLDNPQRIGSADQLDDELMRQMCRAAIELHLDEVELCLQANGGPTLDAWRLGEARPQWPAPDGFPPQWTTPHPVAQQSGPATLLEAWEVARPWFVDPEAAQFSLGTVHPEHWFWGEYDLVYRWTGIPAIVDLKASLGNHDRSHSYVNQMRTYAWLWWETHDRAEIVEDLRIWYLGVPSVKIVEAPDVVELQEIAEQMRELYRVAYEERSEDIADYPMQPAPLRLYEPGGNPAQPEVDDDPLARCAQCIHREVCPSTGLAKNLPSQTVVTHGRMDRQITLAAELATRVDICGEVAGLSGPHMTENGLEVTLVLVQGVDRIKVSNTFMGKPREITRRIANGVTIRIRGARPTEWNLVPSLEIDADSVIEVIHPLDADGEEITGLITGANVIGRVMTVRDGTWVKNRSGSGKPKWRFTMYDATGRIDVVCYAFAVPEIARSIRPGDEIAILNGVLSEFFGRPEIKFQKSTQVVVLKRGEDVPV